MRIAFLLPEPLDLLTGGMVYNHRMAQELRALGHDVQIIGIAGQLPLADDTARHSAQTALATLSDDSIAVIDNIALMAFDRLLDHPTLRQAVVLNHHPTGLEPGLSSETAAALLEFERRVMPRMARVVVTSPATAETLATDFAVQAARITTILPGTDDAPRSRGSLSGPVQILSIGSLIPRKGHDILLRALALLFDLDWRLTIAGTARIDPECAAMLRALPAELGIADRVTLQGETVGQPLADLWDAADLFALATRYEGFGMVIAEALRHGLPVAVCKGGAAGDLVTPECGAVCPVDDVAQLSKSLRRMIFDKRLRQDMAQHAWDKGRTLPFWPEQAARLATTLA